MDVKEQDKIREEAKELLKKFAKSLEKVDIKEPEVSKEQGGMRAEGDGEETDSDFKSRVFKNAPETDGDSIVAEKKKW
tara:strand:- start:11 stop:244 length:234 start_codon:yes stop_codon:yes gene_type:complete